MATDTPAAKSRSRDPEATQKRILQAAKKEFSIKGFGGARIDEVADRAKSNKRMIYHYFGNKEELFQKVIEDAYLDIRTAEKKLNLEQLPPREAIEKLVRFTWEYYLKNPEFLTLVNSENLHRAKHLKNSQVIREAHSNMVSMVGDILDRGAQEGIFRADVDPVQLNITIAAVGYYYLTNRFTGSIIYDRDLMDPAALEARLQFNIDTVLRSLRPD
ncbi:TetR family transcriptional regulator [Marinobacterium nitratireducens]|uniref:TetR family transcriptional regulator n=1 Tax=Marinobacterium nitratireducens TaxID=518897 RepID=A0A917ZJL8_9GAMM|nr:TetR/AcrR family transcriptional regulator [Marinobacterium nitratireducens]GGO83898.1 TetR family transcriptional regulator [Marinobacterium nitratireducens]